ncbi:hypothetical protein ANCCAN_29189 [Ancylostoma caninum]|uniref:Uncharacterized protein n=1 Tax=Ancylostoma caninum TaxID=29170 RepID=A0A368EZ40_ANCCA|nr:hypothetical protein ANCCAN_29189 [Ancylostoma caninum]
MIEVVEVSGQTSVKMTLKDIIEYYKTPREERSTLCNVLSLEFSNTEMETIFHKTANFPILFHEMFYCTCLVTAS